jgi:MoaA/NifB/PqqE/SkfB family radical SAM enzyme
MFTLAARRIDTINSKLGTFPPKLILESTNMCNASCVMCPYPSMIRRKGVMSFELFQKIVDEYSTSSRTTRLQMNNIGEPFLDRSLLKKIRYAKEQGIDSVFCFNNGSQLDGKTSEELIDSGLDEMIISLDGTDKASYEKVRKNLVFEEVLNNIKNLAELKAEKGAQKPRVELHITVSSVNRSEERHFARKMGKIADTVSIAYAHDWAGQLKPDSRGGQGGKRIQGAPCANLWSELTILWNGSVALCCLDYEGKILLGDVNDTSIKTIWNGGKLKRIRALHLKHEFTTPLCQRCTERTWAHWWLNYWD